MDKYIAIKFKALGSGTVMIFFIKKKQIPGKYQNTSSYKRAFVHHPHPLKGLVVWSSTVSDLMVLTTIVCKLI